MTPTHQTKPVEVEAHCILDIHHAAEWLTERGATVTFNEMRLRIHRPGDNWFDSALVGEFLVFDGSNFRVFSAEAFHETFVELPPVQPATIEAPAPSPIPPRGRGRR